MLIFTEKDRKKKSHFHVTWKPELTGQIGSGGSERVFLPVAMANLKVTVSTSETTEDLNEQVCVF